MAHRLANRLKSATKAAIPRRRLRSEKSIESASIAAKLSEPLDASLLDVIDNVLNKGVVIRGEVILGVAGVDLVYLRLSAVLCAADRIHPRKG